ncbi:nicotinamide-nucleotide adenylyltransferase, partial [Candidatus Geothermarchaeota archaeon]
MSVIMVTGALIGRFQPFHLGHLHAIKYCLRSVSDLVIILGSALTSHTLKNPFTARERIQMISLALSEAGISRERYIIIPVPDIGKHSLWVSLV